MKVLKIVALLACLGSFHFAGAAAEENESDTAFIKNYFDSSFINIKVRQKKSACFDFSGIWVSEMEGRVVEIKQDACDYILITDKDLGFSSYFKIGSWVLGNIGGSDDTYLTASRWVEENRFNGRYSQTIDLKNKVCRWTLSEISADRISINMFLSKLDFSSLGYDDFFTRTLREDESEEEVSLETASNLTD